MASIQAIQQSSVHQIQSGQVIVDLNSVVKELVENSLDAGATSIEVRFRNHGLDAIEVVDNGTGISPDDFESVALKHHTSKLRSYHDLENLNTFGFRGEALASLCALSQLYITTARDCDKPRGTRLDFEISGKLKTTSTIAAQRGTKVVVEKIFHNLPVRKKELEKNIKREYAKVLTLLQAYACISTGVRFSVSNQMPKGSKVVAFSTSANAATRDNIINVFGAKTLHALVKLDLKLDMEPTKSGLATQYDGSSREVTIEGHISRPVFGEGRQAPDRQMFFVNSRPCGLPQVSKAVNEVYKSFNVSQSPFIFANLVMDTNSYDVNVSPDKRTILLHDQGALLESLKTALTDLFEAQEQSVPQSNIGAGKLPAYKPLTVARRLEPEDEGASSPVPDPSSTTLDGEDVEPITQKGPPERLIHNWIGRGVQERDQITIPKQQKPPVQNAFDRMRPQRTPHQVAEITIGDKTTTTYIGSGGPASKKRRIHTPKSSLALNLKGFAMSGTQAGSDDEESGDELGSGQDMASDQESALFMSEGEDDDPKVHNERKQQPFTPVSAAVRERTLHPTLSPGSPQSGTQTSPVDMLFSDVYNRKDESEAASDAEYLDEEEKKMREDEKIARMIQQTEEGATRPSESNLKRATQVLGRSKHATVALSQTFDASATSIMQQAKLLPQLPPPSQEPARPSESIVDSADETDAEARLSLIVSKSDFGRMTIVGQFNLGFVIALRPTTDDALDDDLFIIDQHAADEKYNFERYTNSLTLEPQRLAQPKQLHLTAIEEEIVLENAEALTANGFVIDTDTSGASPVGTRCRLLALPMSKETTFDLSDLEELLHLLSEHAGGSVPRPSKVRKMLAMRACRSSIMVGKNLTKSQMRKVVGNLGEMDKPWNCPHGRPTMRHLVGLGSWGSGDSEEEEKRSTDWKGWLDSRKKEKEVTSVSEGLKNGDE